MGVTKPGIQVRIGELVLDGFPADERFRIADDIKREVARVIREQGIAPAGAIRRQVTDAVQGGLKGRRGRK